MMKIQPRPDLEYFAVEGYSEPAWVVRDPLTTQCYQLGNEEHFLLTRFGAVKSLEELRLLFQRQFAPRELTLSELRTLVSDWLMKHLLVGDPLTLARWKQENGIVTENSHSLWKQFLKNPLVIRFRGWDPQKFLSAITPCFRWVYTWPVMVVLGILFATSLMVALLHGSEIPAELSQLPRLYGAEYWLIVLAWISLTKILHELGHAVTCHHFGGRCHEMGVMLLVGIPCLYCNVTDAWTFRKKSQRLLVSAAGIVVDLTIASIALWLWHLTEPGLLHSVCLLLARLGSLNSALLNGNPLMRYDGYYISSDLAGQPNLRSESMKQARSLVWRGLMGKRQQKQEAVVSIGLIGYGVLAGCYLWLIIALILTGAYQALKPWGAENLMLLFGIILVPLQLAGMGMRWSREGKREFLLRGQPIWRMRLGLTALTCLLLFLLLIPFPRRVPALGILQADDVAPVVCVEAGLLIQPLTTSGRLSSGQVLFQLKNPELEQEWTALETSRLTIEAAEQAIQKKRTQLIDSAEVLATLTEQKQSVMTQQQRLQKQCDELLVKSESTGQYLPDPLGITATREQRDFWPELHTLSTDNRGRLLMPGEPLGEVSLRQNYRALIALEERWAEKVTPGVNVLVFLPETGGTPHRGTLISLSSTATRLGDADSSAGTSSLTALKTLTAQSPWGAETSVLTGWVDIQTDVSVDWNLYQSCQVRIDTAPASLFQRGFEFLQRNWRK